MLVAPAAPIFAFLAALYFGALYGGASFDILFAGWFWIESIFYLVIVWGLTRKFFVASLVADFDGRGNFTGIRSLGTTVTLGNILLVVICFFIGQFNGWYLAYSKEDIPKHTMTTGAPVDLAVFADRGASWVTFTNRGDEVLVDAKAKCTAFYGDTEKPVEKDFVIAPAADLLPGESESRMAAEGFVLADHNADPARTRCDLVFATFRKKSGFETEMTIGEYGADPLTRKMLISVMNRSAVPITRLRFVCWDNGDKALEKDKITSWPANQSDKLAEQVIRPGETGRFWTDSSGSYDHCEIINIREA